MRSNSKSLTARQTLNIPLSVLPLAVLSDNQTSWISTAIKLHEDGNFNHFMWMHRPGYVTTQGWTLHEAPIADYLKNHRLKFWACPAWGPKQRRDLRMHLLKLIDRPWYKRLYDPVQILGKLTGLDWLQIPGNMRICSDYIDLVAEVDPGWDTGQHLSPPEINRMMQGSGRWGVYGRYSVD